MLCQIKPPFQGAESPRHLRDVRPAKGELVSTFRFHCYRDFKSYAGKVSAIHEVLELAVREFQGAAEASGDPEKFIDEAAKKHGLHVRFAQCPDIISRAIQLHIVNVHEAFEQFLSELRAECVTIREMEWKDYDRKSTLYVTLQNIFKTQEAAKDKVGAMEVELCDYYRHVRNEVVHADVQPEGLRDEFQKVEGYRKQAADTYQKLGVAPNPADALTRDDFHLFIRVAQDVAWELCQAARPSDEQLAKAIADQVAGFQKRWPGQPERVANAAISILEKQFGLDRGDAARIATTVL
jgi:hypothetical protein